MSRRLIFVSFWSEALKEIVDFLKSNEYTDSKMIEHMESLLEGKKK